MFRVLRVFVVLCILLFVSSCQKDSILKNEGSLSPVATESTMSVMPSSKDKLDEFKPEDRFTGQWLDGKKFDSLEYQGQKIILGFFSYKHRDATHMLKSLMKLKSYQIEYNFRIFLVSLDYGKNQVVKEYLDKNGIDLPVLIDSQDLEIAQKFNIQNEVTLVGLSNKHTVEFGFKKYVFAEMEDGETLFLNYIKESLNIRTQQSTRPRLGIFPKAPDFEAKALDGKTYKLSQFIGKKAVIVIFFSPKCPHCQHEMMYFRDKFYANPEFKDLEILAFSVLPLSGETLKLYDSFKFKWPVFDDSKRKVHNLYSDERGVPENYFIDKQGKIREFITGYPETRQNKYIMLLKDMLNLPNPPLLSDKQYNGSDTCMICHEAQYVSWSVTPHAHAWETLEIKGEDTNPECVGCHSVGFNDPKGYRSIKNNKTGQELAHAPDWLQNVQCENCHGIGGPHVMEVNMLAKDKLKETCLTCHTKKFSLHFDFDERIQKVNHSDKDKIMKMSEQERLELLKKVAKKPDDLFDTKIAYVGNEKCLECHKDIVHTWNDSAHGQAFETLKKAGKETDAACLECHTVGYSEASGYKAHIGDANFEGVGCESCHGPGAKHVQSKRKDDIRGLGDDCPFCVVEQICLSCHTEEQSPGFNIYKGLEQVKKDHNISR